MMIFKQQYIKYFVISVLISAFLFSATTDFASAKPKASKAKPTQKSRPVQKSKSKSKTQVKTKTSSKKKKKKRRVRRPPFKETSIKMNSPLVSVTDSVLTKGVTYHNYLLGAKYKHNLHVVELDLKEATSRMEVLKAYHHYDELQKLQEMNALYDSVSGKKVLASVNGNFWRAVTNYPIGPTISDGEVVEMNTYKLWTSGLVSENGELYIDNFFINGKIYTKKGILLDIRTVNRRKDSTGIVFYNKFAGDSIPYVPLNNISKEIKKAMSELEKDSEFADSTDDEIDTMMVQNEIMNQKKIAKIEYNLPKFSVKYLDQPGINKEIRCVVKRFSEKTAPVQKHGGVISFGKDIPEEYYPAVGDTIYLKFETDEHKDVVFRTGVSGTPRLVRNGIAKHEAEHEGSHGGRFIKWQLPRTSIGTNEDGSKIYMVIVEPTGLHQNCYGANLSQLSLIMKRLGCYNAMNLDGGGSTIMVMNGKNIMLKNRPEASRRVSVGVAISEPK